MHGDAGYQGVGKREENRDAAVDWRTAMKPGPGEEPAADRASARLHGPAGGGALRDGLNAGQLRPFSAETAGNGAKDREAAFSGAVRFTDHGGSNRTVQFDEVAVTVPVDLESGEVGVGVGLLWRP